MRRDPRAEEIRDLFLSEVRASTRVKHPNLVTVFTAGTTADGLPAIAMEFVPGDPLESLLLRASPLTNRDLGCMEGIFSAIAALHRGAIVHRDVTPPNIIVSRDHAGQLQVKLLDFGIAEASSEGGRRAALGTPPFAAPEQLMGRAVPASDVHAAGAILWWALTGRAYLEEHASLEEMMRHQLGATVAPDPRSVLADAPPVLAELASSMLHPDASRRPTAQAVLDRWPGILDGARQWTRRHRPRRPSGVVGAMRRKLSILVVCPDPVKRYLIADFCEPLGCSVTTTADPRKATRGELGTFDVAVLSTELGSVDASSVARHLREFYPAQRLVLMASAGERILSHAEVDGDLDLVVPGELNRLADYLQSFGRHRPSTKTPLLTLETRQVISERVLEAWKSQPPEERREALAEFIGRVPTLLSELEDLDPRVDLSPVLDGCVELERRASTFGATHLARLARSLRMLLEADAVGDHGPFVREIEAEYLTVFRTLMETTKAHR